MPKISPENNFADISEAATKLLKSTKNDDVRTLSEFIMALTKRCDNLEREVEKLMLAAEKPKAAKKK
jgi:hypothetical protein